MDEQIDPHIAAFTRKKPEHKPAPELPAELAPEEEPRNVVFLWVLIVIAILFVAVIMVRTVYHPGPPVNKVTYNKFEFTQLSDNFWEFQWQKGNAVYNVPLHYNPTELNNVTVTGQLDAAFGMRQEVYIAIDPSNRTDLQYEGLAVGEIGLNLIKAFQVDLKPACTRNETATCFTRPVVNCENDPDKSIIIVREGAGPTVIQDGSCVIVRGKDMGLLQAADRLLFKFYKIMD